MPFRAKTTGAFNALSIAAMKAEYYRLHCSWKGRGKSIGNLYSALQWALNNHHPYVAANEPNEDEPLLNPADDLENRIQQLHDSIVAADGDQQPLSVQCTICFENYNGSNKRPCIFKCGHHVCSGCFVNFTRNRVGNRECPHCRKVISEFTLMYT